MKGANVRKASAVSERNIQRLTVHHLSVFEYFLSGNQCKDYPLGMSWSVLGACGLGAEDFRPLQDASCAGISTYCIIKRLNYYIIIIREHLRVLGSCKPI